MTKTIVAGVGMVKFQKPGQHDPYRLAGAAAIREALKDASLGAETLDQAFASYIFGSTGAGQNVVYDVVQSGIPIFNVNNACASGSSALILARQAISSGMAECVLAVGFEEMSPGAIQYEDQQENVGVRIENLLDEQGYPSGPITTPRWFGAAGKQYMETYGATPDLFAKVAVKTRNHAAANPYALFSSPITEEEVLQSKVIWGDYMTKFMACPPSCGAAAAVLVSEEFAKRHAVEGGVEIVAQALATDKEDSWLDAMGAAGAHNTERAASAVYEEAGIGPEDVDVVELHDCFTPNEVITYEGLGLCPKGGATEFVAQGDNTYGGKYVVNPSGGLMSKGHPIGATGLAQCTELVWQLRGQAGARQVQGAQIALQHNIGLVAAAAVSMYRPWN